MQKAHKKISIKELAALCGGSITGDSSVCVFGLASVVEAEEGDVTFLSGAKNYASYLEALKTSKAAAVIAPKNAPDLPIPAIRVENPYYGLIKACEFFYKKQKPSYNIHKTAFVSESAKVAPSAVIGPHAVIEDNAEVGENAQIGALCCVSEGARVGQDTVLYPGVKILSGCSVGKRCILHANAVVGSDGFGFTLNEGRQLKVPQLGCVIIEDDVEIGACTAIDRGAMSDTKIGSGTKIDNHVHVAHNVQIGKNCVIVAKVGISGSTIIEDNVTMAGQSATVGHVRIGKGSTIAARGVATKDIEPGVLVSGFPIKPHSEEKKIMISLAKLPELIKRVRALEKQLEANHAERAYK